MKQSTIRAALRAKMAEKPNQRIGLRLLTPEDTAKLRLDYEAHRRQGKQASALIVALIGLLLIGMAVGWLVWTLMHGSGRA